MIVRLWRGRTPRAKADSHLGYLERTGFRAPTSTEGNRVDFVLRRFAGRAPSGRSTVRRT